MLHLHSDTSWVYCVIKPFKRCFILRGDTCLSSLLVISIPHILFNLYLLSHILIINSKLLFLINIIKYEFRFLIELLKLCFVNMVNLLLVILLRAAIAFALILKVEFLINPALFYEKRVKVNAKWTIRGPDKRKVISFVNSISIQMNWMDQVLFRSRSCKSNMRRNFMRTSLNLYTKSKLTTMIMIA